MFFFSLALNQICPVNFLEVVFAFSSHSHTSAKFCMVQLNRDKHCSGITTQIYQHWENIVFQSNLIRTFKVRPELCPCPRSTWVPQVTNQLLHLSTGHPGFPGAPCNFSVTTALETFPLVTTCKTPVTVFLVIQSNNT